ncbi:MAG TPA: amidohydrolase [Thermoanaerobaculia bacterium]|nr:amidohydrolase [Thermoanaerobaculia bacterium]
MPRCRAESFVLATAFAILAAAPGGLAQTSSSRVDQEVGSELPSLVGTYKSLHEAPELSGHEQKTSAFIADQLRALGFTVIDHIGKYEDPSLTGYGVAAVMKNGSGPTVLVRTELDALPVTEATGLPYASTVKTKNPDGQEVGVMHACGHDIHMTSFLGTARALVEMKDRWHGTLEMIAQPAEEIGKGADAMLSDGLYQKIPKPDYVLALHDSSQLEAGKVAYCPGYALANIDSVDITLRGVGGHGAMPSHTKDPVVLAAETVIAIQTIASREISPLDPIVVTVGSIHGGTKRNVIPDQVVLQLTVRTYKPEVREKVLAALRRIPKGLAEAAGIPKDRMPMVTVSKTERGDALYNDPALAARMAKVWEKAFGKENVLRIPPEMVSEDVGHFGLDRTIPVLQFRIGAVAPALMKEHMETGKPLPPLHSALFAPLPGPTIRTGVKAMTVAVLDLMGQD